MATIQIKHISFSDVPESIHQELFAEADMISGDALDDRIILYTQTINNIIVANNGLDDNSPNREHSAELVAFAQSIYDHITDWFIIE